MTWAHYQQLKQAAQARIAEKIAALQPTGGAGVAINGNSIALDVPRRIVQEETAPTWELAVLGKVKGRIAGYADGDVLFETEWEVAASVSRTSGIVSSSGFWQRTQMFDIAQGEDPRLVRSYDLELKVMTYNGGFFVDTLDRGIYRVPVVLVVEEYEIIERPGPTGGVFVENKVIRTHRFTLRRPVFKRRFEAENPGVFSYLRAVAIERG